MFLSATAQDHGNKEGNGIKASQVHNSLATDIGLPSRTQEGMGQMAGLHERPVYALSIVCHMLERAAQVVVDNLRISCIYVLVCSRPHRELHACY